MVKIFRAARERLAAFTASCGRVLGGGSKIVSGPAAGLRFDAGSQTHRFVSGRYERPVQEVLASVVKAGDACCDVGANLGFFSLLMSRLSGPSGTVYAFEPVPKNAVTIEENVDLNGLTNVTVLRVALSCLDGEGELLLARHVGGAVLKSAGTPPDLAGSMRVEIVSLDTLVERRSIRPPAVVKIDVEGAEMEVLQGMKQVLREIAPVIILEFDDESANACERKMSSCCSYLQDAGYRTELLANSYPDGNWIVRHVLARPTHSRRRTNRGS